MSIKLMSRVWDYDFDHAEQSILMAMADHANDNGEHVFPSIRLIAWKTGYSERQTQRIIGQLKERRVLIEVAPANRYRPTEYRINLDAAALKPLLENRGDKMSPLTKTGVTFDKPGVTFSPSNQVSGVTFSPSRGDTAMAPEPSVEPSVREPSRETPECRQQSLAFGESPDSHESGTHTHSRQKRKKPEQQTAPEQQGLFGALCQCVGWDSSTITEQQRMQVAQTLKILQRHGYKAVDVERFSANWRANDWRWRQNKSYPTLSQVRAEIARIRQQEAPPAFPDDPQTQEDIITESPVFEFDFRKKKAS